MKFINLPLIQMKYVRLLVNIHLSNWFPGLIKRILVIDINTNYIPKKWHRDSRIRWMVHLRQHKKADIIFIHSPNQSKKWSKSSYWMNLKKNITTKSMCPNPNNKHISVNKLAYHIYWSSVRHSSPFIVL